jgi:beta-lactamase regulating signal transducer with metallopeptidase domain/protein involved in polysaccharide export with SLBB domain
VWQGALLGLASWLLQRLVRSPQARYITGVVTLAAMLVAFVWTTLNLVPARTAWVTTVTEIEGQFESASLTGHVIEGGAPAASGLPSDWIVALWALGLLTFATRAAGGWMLARRLTRVGVSPVAPWVLEQAQELSASMGITRSVRVLLSTRVPAPVLIGWIAPVILLPVTALTGLSSAQVSALLAHELAHVRRYDYLVNLLQTMVEAAFFFHPAVWLISRRVREDRELCCDDLAVQVCDRLTYATTLHTLAQRRPAALALGATGGSLVNRVRRITSAGTPSPTPKSAWIVLLPLVVVLSLAIPSASSEPVLPALPHTPLVGTPVPTIASVRMSQTAAEDRAQLVQSITLTDWQSRRRMLRAQQDLLDTLRRQLAELQQQREREAAMGYHRKGDDIVAILREETARVEMSVAELTLQLESLEQRRADLNAESQRAQARPTWPVALGYFVPPVNAAPLSEAPIVQQQAKAAEPVLHEVFVQGYVVRPGVRMVEANDSTVMRLIELSGGVSARAGDTVTIRGWDGKPRLQLKLSDLTSQDVAVHPGETVYVLPAPPKAGDIVIINRPATSADVTQASMPAQPTEFVEVGGEVNKPGKIAWKEGMTVRDAIEQAGGMTSRGKLGTVRWLEDKPDGSRVWVELKGSKLTLDTVLKPGDRLTIPRKFWGGN